MNKVCIIAEAGVNHNGSIELALELCRKAKETKADFIKFQTFRTEKVLTRYAPTADYQKKNVRKNKTQFEIVKELELSYQDFRRIKDYCDKIGIGFLSTPDEEESLDFLVSLGIKMIKIGSGEITNVPYLKKVGNKNKDVILSTGMSTLSEVKVAYSTLMNAGAKSVSLLHCTTSYPCLPEEANLKAIQTLKKHFKTKVGYSDHTLGIEASIAAVALGAEIIEKHFTLDKNMPGPDHKASLTLVELKMMIMAIRNVEKALGDGVKKLAYSELKNIDVVRKSIVAATDIKKGEVFTEENVTIKRPATGISPVNWDRVIGSLAKRNFKIDELIEI